MRDNLLPLFLNGRIRTRRKEMEIHLIKEYLPKPKDTLRTQEYKKEMLRDTIIIERVTILEITPKGNIRYEETLQGPTIITMATKTKSHMIEEVIEEKGEGMVEEEEALLMIMEKFMVHKRGQQTPCMKGMPIINLNISFFLLFLLHLLWMLGIISLVDSGASHHFSLYREVISNLVERKSCFNIILGYKFNHPIKCSEFAKFYLECGESILIHDVIYLS